MIIALTGMPGSGKSYALVARAYKALKQGRPVFANFPIRGCYMFNMDDLCKYAFPENAVVIIDEAGRWFNSHNWKSLPPEVFDLFTMHRHLNCDMYIGVQSFARIDKSLREVVELTYWAYNHPILPFHSYRGYYDLEKVGSMRKDHDVSFFLLKRKRYRNMYNTFSMKSAFVGKEEMPRIKYSLFPKSKFKIIKRFIRKKKNKMKKNIRIRLRFVRMKKNSLVRKFRERRLKVDD